MLQMSNLWHLLSANLKHPIKILCKTVARPLDCLLVTSWRSVVGHGFDKSQMKWPT